MKTPRISSSTDCGSATNTLAPAIAPITAPAMNGSTVPRITSRHMIMVRVMPEPSITTVWTGSSTAGGMAIAIRPSSMTPPAAPVNTPSKGGDERRRGQAEEDQRVDAGRAEEIHALLCAVGLRRERKVPAQDLRAFAASS